MNKLTDTARTAECVGGEIIIRMKSCREIRFRAEENPRLARGTTAQLSRIKISPFGIHWPELDEVLSFRGLFEGNHGQRKKNSE